METLKIFRLCDLLKMSTGTQVGTKQKKNTI